MKKPRPVTLLLPTEKRIRRLDVGAFGVAALLASSAALIGLLAFGSFFFVEAAYWKITGWYANSENKVTTEYLSCLDREVTKFDGLLQSVFHSDDLVRSLYDLEPISSDARLVGIGGVNLSLGPDAELLRMERQIAFESWNLKRTRKGILEKMNAFSRMPLVMPTRGRLTSRFGVRMHPVLESTDFHEGLDIANHRGTTVYAPAKGRVSAVGFDKISGRFVRLDHGNGYETRYAHLQKISVAQGQAVERYEDIGTIGSTGRATGDHLHYEILLNGNPRNPETYILPDNYVVD